MESSRADPAPGPGAATLVRALCWLVLLLMTAAAVYGASMAVRYYSQIGV